MDPATAANAAKWGAAIWKAVGGGIITGLLKPGQVRREGMAAIDVAYNKKLALTQAKLDAQDIIDGKKSYSIEQKRLISHETSRSFAQLNPPCEENQAPEPMQSVLEVIAAEKLISEINIAQAATHAEAELANETSQPPDTSPSQDWVTRWRDYAQKVSEDEMQELWGRILAGEIKQPGTFSFRALEMLKNLSREDADLISKISRFVIGDFIFKPDDREFFRRKDLGIVELLEAEELGILVGVSGLGLERKVSSSGNLLQTYYTTNDYVIIVKSSELDKLIKIPIYKVSKLGQQILPLAKANDDPDYIKKFRDKFIEQGCEVGIHEIISRSGDSASFKTTPTTIN